MPHDPTPSSPGRPARTLGGYELLGPLGQGGMGAVLRARHLELGTVRALKVRQGTSEAGARRFAREIEHLARVRHPNVVAIHEGGVERGCAYFAMDLVEGEPLDELLSEGGLPWRRALDLCLGLCRGVGALHELGLIHRDLKPANVMVSAAGEPILIDFGLAIDPHNDERLTRTGALVGTVVYMAPEQVGGAEPDPRSDVYALGLILHELLTGRCALDPEESTPILIRQILSGVHPRPSALAPDLPARLDRIVRRACAKDPAERYPDADALADDLSAARDAPGLSAARLRLALGASLALLSLALLSLVAVVIGKRRPPSAPEPAAQAGAEPSPTSSVDPALRRAARAAALRLDPKLPLPRLHEEALVWLERYGAAAPGQARRLRQRVERLAAEEPYLTLPAARDGAFLPGEAAEARLLVGGESPRLLRFALPEGRQLSARSLRGPLRPAPGCLIRGRQVLDRAGQVVATSPFPLRAAAGAGSRYALGGPEGQLAWAARGSAPRRLAAQVPGPVNALALSPQGDLLLAANWGNLNRGRPPAALLVALPSGEVLGRHPLVGSGLAARFHPHEPLVALGTTMGRVLIFASDRPRAAPRPLVGSGIDFRPTPFMKVAPACRGRVASVAWSWEGERLFAASRGADAWRVRPNVDEELGPGGDLRGWNLGSGAELLVQVGAAHARWVAPDASGRWLLVGYEDATRLWLRRAFDD